MSPEGGDEGLTREEREALRASIRRAINEGNFRRVRAFAPPPHATFSPMDEPRDATALDRWIETWGPFWWLLSLLAAALWWEGWPDLARGALLLTGAAGIYWSGYQRKRRIQWFVMQDRNRRTQQTEDALRASLDRERRDRELS